MNRARLLLGKLLLLLPVLLGVLIVSHAITWMRPEPVEAGGISLRVLLDAQPDRLEIDASEIVTHPAPEFELQPPVEIRTQSCGLLLVAAGTPWVLDDDELEIAWQGRGRFAWEDREGAGHRSHHVGSLRVTRREGRLRLILTTGLETYVTGVVDGEMGFRFPREALKAQAVAARSFAWSALTRRRDRDWHVRANAMDQVYTEASERPAVVAAVRATLGEFLLWEGVPLRAYYASTCGGRTREGRERFGDVPRKALPPVDCTTCVRSPLFRWRRMLAFERLKELGIDPGRRPIEIQAQRTSPRGDWIEWRIRSGRGSWRTYPFRRLARLLSLPSPWITQARTGARGVVLAGRGFGHGVGMCQYGAAGLAREGRGYREILNHYYPGCEIGPLDLQPAEVR